jgi:hypothetical protein
MMKSKLMSYLLLGMSVVVVGACGSKPTGSGANTNTASEPVTQKTPGPLAERGFRAVITLVDPPTKLRTGQKEIIKVKVKNASDITWFVRGGEVNDRPDNTFYIAAGNRWLDKQGAVLTSMDGRIGLSKNLNPGEETEETLQITAPSEPGDYILEVDLVQEQVAWFHDKGSPTARTNVTVVR